MHFYPFNWRAHGQTDRHDTHAVNIKNKVTLLTCILVDPLSLFLIWSLSLNVRSFFTLATRPTVSGASSLLLSLITLFPSVILHCRSYSSCLRSLCTSYIREMEWEFRLSVSLIDEEIERRETVGQREKKAEGERVRYRVRLRVSEFLRLEWAESRQETSIQHRIVTVHCHCQIVAVK